MTELLPEEIRTAMSPGEQALWWGRPRQGIVLRGSDLYAIPFSLMWCGFAIFWEMGVLSSAKAPTFFALWGIPFVGYGLYLVIGRFFVEARQREMTFYALTSERVLIVSGVFTSTTKSLSLDTLTDITLTESGSGGKGTITFGPQGAFASRFGGTAWPGSRQQLPPSFDLVDEAKVVYERIRTAQRATR
jgi:hypothetical protein